MSKKSNGIAVDVDRPELSEAIQKVALNNGYGWPSEEIRNEKSKFLIFKQDGGNSQDKKSISFQDKGKTGSWITQEESVDFLKEKYGTIYELPQDWDKVVGYLEGNNFTFKGYQTEYHYDSDVVEIGCRDFRVNIIINLLKLMDEMSINEVTYGDGIDISKDELCELIDWVKSQ